MRANRPFRLRFSSTTRKRIVFFAIVFFLAAGIRLLTYNFMRARLHDAAWFQHGSYGVFDNTARSILDGSGRLFWIDDPSRTDLAQYPPAFPWLVAAVYSVTGNHSAYSVQTLQSILDLILCMVLVTGVAVTAFGWPTGMTASVMAALSPLLAMVGVSPAADAPTAWFVVGGLWLLLIAARRQSWRWACGAGLLLGAACWIRVNPLYLSLFWAAALLLFVRAGWRRRLLLGSVVVLTTILVISPIVIRNYLVFPDFSPTGGTIGANLWEGLGETELGRNHGFLFGDDKMVERERIKSGLPANAPFEAMWPDGIRRDRERARESLAFIKQHPVWYAGVMLHRMWGMVRTAGAPLPYYGTSGINVTSLKCLPPARQGGILGAFVTGLGMVQSVSRYALLPLALLGLGIGMRWDWRITSILLMTIVYYLVPGTFAHTEIRYVLPVHYLLPVFAGAAIVWSAVTCQRFLKASQNRRLQS